MTPEEKLDQEILWVLDQIKKEELLTLKNDTKNIASVISLDEDSLFETNDNSPSQRTQLKILNKLDDIGAIYLQFSRALTIGSYVAVPNGVTGLSDEYKHKDFITIQTLRPKFDEVYSEYKNKTSKIFIPDLSNADKKRLYILEKLKEEWDLVPKQNSETMRVNGRTVYGRQARETNVSWERHDSWQNESGMDYYQLENILTGFQNEGLIDNFESINPAR